MMILVVDSILLLLPVFHCLRVRGMHIGRPRIALLSSSRCLASANRHVSAEVMCICESYLLLHWSLQATSGLDTEQH